MASENRMLNVLADLDALIADVEAFCTGKAVADGGVGAGQAPGAHPARFGVKRAGPAGATEEKKTHPARLGVKTAPKKHPGRLGVKRGGGGAAQKKGGDPVSAAMDCAFDENNVFAGDEAWDPVVPRGHTEYSWFADDEEQDAAVGAAVDAALRGGGGGGGGGGEAAERKHAAGAPPAGTEGTDEEKQPKKQQKKQKQQKQQKQQNQKQQKQKQGKKGGATGAPAIARLELRVGLVVEAQKLEGSEKLYIEKIALGEEEPRQILSGLAPFVSLDDLIGSKVVVATNLKPSKLAGSMSYGMVLCASNEAHDAVEILRPDDGAKVGERVIVKGMEADFAANPADDEINARKKKNNVWLEAAEGLRTTGDGVGAYNNAPLIGAETGSGCSVASLGGCAIR